MLMLKTHLLLSFLGFGGEFGEEVGKGECICMRDGRGWRGGGRSGESCTNLEELALAVGNWWGGFGRGSSGLTSSLNLEDPVGLLPPPSFRFFTNKALETLYFF